MKRLVESQRQHFINGDFGLSFCLYFLSKLILGTVAWSPLEKKELNMQVERIWICTDGKCQCRTGTEVVPRYDAYPEGNGIQTK